MTILYGIKNCDSVKKARLWLDKHEIAYEFHDFRVAGLEPEQLAYFIEKAGWENVLNRRSASWRQLTDEQKTDLNVAKATSLMLDNLTLIKRPVLQTNEQVLTGFNQQKYQTLL
ncbi:ArsC family reductase [Methyloprofundus sp.]|uniref:ArsC family reductase n=1 Tax=Methyloprofundus sp. TaxID=2020875 RepID=UPI003D0DED09